MRIFAANWKMNKTPDEARKFCEQFKSFQPASGSEVVIFPSSLCLEAVSTVLKDSKIHFGAQNSYLEAKGAFTGETSAAVVKALGGKYILLGHSERRTFFHESDDLIARKFQFVQSLDLVPMLCIGETLAQREADETAAVLTQQIKKGLEYLNPEKPFVIAYEPVWAIGTGKVATPEQVQETHAEVFHQLNNIIPAGKIPILYGGSVKADNAKELIAIPNVSGFLVGGASLEADSFKAICEA